MMFKFKYILFFLLIFAFQKPLFSQRMGEARFGNEKIEELLILTLLWGIEEKPSSDKFSVFRKSYLDQQQLKYGCQNDTVYNHIVSIDTLLGELVIDRKIVERNWVNTCKIYGDGIEFLLIDNNLVTNKDTSFVNFYLRRKDINKLKDPYLYVPFFNLASEMYKEGIDTFNYEFCVNMLCQIQRKILNEENRKYLISTYLGEVFPLDTIGLNFDMFYTYAGKVSNRKFIDDSLFFINRTGFSLGFSIDSRREKIKYNYISFCYVKKDFWIRNVGIPCKKIGVRKKHFAKVFTPIELAFINLLTDSFFSLQLSCE